MIPLGTPAPAFSLPDTDGNIVSLEDSDTAPALLVMFLSNHCPYIQHVRPRLAELTREYMAKGVAVVGINSSDIDAHPDDSPERMAEEKKRVGYPFPYLFDESQRVARAYSAACTPDFFVFDRHRRGQMDDARPGNRKPVTGADLTRALDAVLAGEGVPGINVRAWAATSSGSQVTNRAEHRDQHAPRQVRGHAPDWLGLSLRTR